MGLMDFFKKGVEKPVPVANKPITKPAEASNYVVKEGDSLSLIAKQYYGDAQKWNIIFEANKSQIKDPNKIFPGMAIKIPVL